MQAKPTPNTDQAPTRDDLSVLHTRELFRGRREVLIEHEGFLYRLKITRRGKLILNK